MEEDRTMKKRIKTMWFVVLLAILVSSILPVTTVQAATKKTAEEKAIDYLDKAASSCDTVMDSIYGSWYFQVYKADDYYNKSILQPYASYSGISASKVKKIIKKEYGETDGAGIAACIQVLGYNLGIVNTYYTDKGTFDKIENNLKKAKTNINKVKDSKEKKQLQKYYKAVNKYYKFVKSPTGSFAQLGSKMDSLKEAVEDCQEDLSW
jgi:hypothetical protein